MNSDRIRVLADLSYASMGFCGIAQESRLFFKSIWENGRVDPTGLVFSRGDAVLGHQFLSNCLFNERIENQATYLQSLVDGPPRGTRLDAWKHLVAVVYRRFFSRRVNSDRLDNEFFWDAVWRNLFARTLSVRDIAISRKCRFLLANLGGSMLGGRTLFAGRKAKLDSRGFEFAVFHNATPVQLSPETTKLVRYYDLIPGIRPDLVSDRKSVRNHFRDIRLCRNDSEFVCISESARADLLAVFPELEPRTHCIPVVLSDGYYHDPQPNRFAQILDARKSEVAARHPKRFIRGIAASVQTPPYLIMTSTLEPRKNFVALIRAFEKLIAKHDTDLRLVIVANPGWKYHESTRAMIPLIKNGRLFHLESATTEELRILYSQAQALVFPSLYEGFGYTPLEAMLCRTPVVVSDIAAHRWVCGDAALYCDPYDSGSLAKQVESLLFPANAALRDDLVEKGLRRAGIYSSKIVGDQWLQLFDQLRSRKTGVQRTRASVPESPIQSEGDDSQASKANAA